MSSSFMLVMISLVKPSEACGNICLSKIQFLSLSLFFFFGHATQPQRLALPSSLGFMERSRAAARTGLALERGLEAALGLGLSPPASPLSSTSLRAFPLNFHEHISFYPRMMRHQLGQAHVLSFQTTLLGPCDPQLMGLNII